MENRIYILKLSDYEADEARLRLFYSWLSVQKREKLERLRRREDRLRSLIGDAAVRKLYFEVSGRPPESAEIVFNRYNKPSFPGGYPFNFSISHSGEYVICAVSDDECGADIEKISLDHGGLHELVCTEYEQRYLERFSGNERSREFFRLWTLKESLVKLIGKGLYMDLRKAGFVDEHIRLISYIDGYNAYSYSDFIGEEYVLSVCGSGTFRKVTDPELI